MSLADALASQKQNKPGPKCSTCRFLTTLPEEDRATLLGAFAGNYQTAEIGRALRETYPDSDIPADCSLGRHRKGLCK